MRRYLQRLVMRNAAGATAHPPTPLLPNRPRAASEGTDDPFESTEAGPALPSAPSFHADAVSPAEKPPASTAHESIARRSPGLAESILPRSEPIDQMLGTLPAAPRVQQVRYAPGEREAAAFQPAPVYSPPGNIEAGDAVIGPVAQAISRSTPGLATPISSILPTSPQARGNRLPRPPDDLAPSWRTAQQLDEGFRQVAVKVDNRSELPVREALLPQSGIEQAWEMRREQVLRPQASVPTLATLPQPELPRVVIGHLSVEVIPESHQPPATVPLSPAQSGRADSAHEEAAYSILRFGLGQL